MRLVLQNVLWILLFVAYQYICLANSGVNVGVFLDQEDDQSEVSLNSTLLRRNVYDRKTHFDSTVKRLSNFESGFDVSKILCEVLGTGNGVGAVIDTTSEPISDVLHSICTDFEVPYISTRWRSTPSKSQTTFNFFPMADIFQEGLAEIVKSLGWNSFVVIYESDEGLIKLQEVLKLQAYSSETKRNSILLKQLGPGMDHRTLLKEVKNSTENNILLDCRTENIIPILQQAKNLDLLNLHYNYFITSLDAHTLESDFTNLDATANITTIRLFDYTNEKVSQTIRNWNQYSKDEIGYPPNMIKTETLLFHDAVDLLTEAINDLSRTGNIETNSINCSIRSVAKNGFNTVLYMKSKRTTQAVTAPLKFDERGNRVAFDIHIIDTLDNKIIATWHAESRSLDLTRSSSETENAIVANLQKTTVIVSSRIGEPYLMYREPEEGKELVGNDRYEGYSMDLIREIAKIVPFGSFEFHLTADGQYGKFDEKQRKWTGLIGDLLEKRAHLAICDLTITHQRREVVDFSMPFMTLGIGILYRKAEKKDINMFAFLDPFSVPVWICTATLYLVISVVLYFVSRMTPGDWENPHPCDENPEELENIWDIKNCMWLTLGSIMTQGCDILPKGISSRLAVSMWWFFSLILTSSYTANLAAFLTKDRMEPTIDGAEALSKQTKIKYGAVDGGSTQAFFRDSNFTTYQRMWLSMQQARPGVFEKNNADGVARVQSSKGKYAFLMESTQIEYEEETKCDLKKVGGSLDTKSYGIAMPINSPYRSAINKAILKLQEGGVLAELKEKWWKDKRKEPSCDKPDSEEADGAELALANIGGVFYVLGIGVAAAFVLAICEFLWNVRTVSVEEHMTFTEALKVELKFACNIWITKKRTKLVVSESSGSSQRSDKTDNALHTSAAYTNISKSS